MQLTDLSIQVRQRSAWEAIDLGFALVQQYWRTLIIPYTLLVLCIAIPVWLILPESYLWISSLIIWWLKPLYDRLILYILSRQLFNQTTTTAEAFSALPQLIFHTGLWSALSYRRFSFSRSYNLAIWQLEGLRGSALKERQALIYLQGHSNAVWLTIGCVHLEWIILFSLYALILMLDPSGAIWEHIKGLFRGDLDMDTQYWYSLLDFIFLILTILVIEPFYVAAGFMLYINRRTQLEAWDLEIAFRKLGERLTELTQTGRSLLASLMLFLVISTLGLSLAPPIHAQSLSKTETKNEILAPERLPAEQATTQINQVMQLEELSNRRKINTWLPKDKSTQQDDENQLPEDFIQLMASLLKTLLWIGVILALILALIYRHKILALLSPLQKPVQLSTIPEVLFGLDIRPASLPEDIAGTARQLWEAGHAREALSLLYRGALVILTHQEQLAIHASHTEGDILQLAKPITAPERYAYLRTLTQLWQTIAYAHRTPKTSELLPLFEAWSSFQTPRVAQVASEVTS